MPKAKLAITIERNLVTGLDSLIKRRRFTSRSHAIQEAVREHLQRVGRSRLAEECAKLDPLAEQALAEEGFDAGCEQWPEY